MRKKLLCFALSCLLLTSAALASAELTITATFYPLYLAAINLAHGVAGVTVQCMAPAQAGCLHDYQMTTADRKLLSDSDVIIYNGAGLEVFMDPLLPTLSGALVEASRGIELLAGDHEAYNPHVWTSVAGMMAQVQNIADGLCQADPGNEAQYRANAAGYMERLEALRAELSQTLAPCAGEPIVTFHEAFDYFAAEYGLRVVAVVTHDTGTAPAARQLAQVAQTIRAEGVKALFAEPQYEDASVRVLSRETGVPVYLLDPVVSGDVNAQDLDAYPRVMRENARTVIEALP